MSNEVYPDPKPTRVKLKPGDYEKLKEKIYYKQNQRCKYCSRWLPLDLGGSFSLYYTFQLHHIKSRGAGGEDTDANCVGVCFDCHRLIHDGTIKNRPPEISGTLDHAT